MGDYFIPRDINYIITRDSYQFARFSMSHSV